MKTILVVAVLACGCGGGAGAPSVVSPAEFCEGFAGAYCDEEYDCLTIPDVCDWAGYYNRCVARYACLVEIVDDGLCYREIDPDPHGCDGTVGIPHSCPETCR